jgi:hypothetical protein
MTQVETETGYFVTIRRGEERFYVRFWPKADMRLCTGLTATTAFLSTHTN